MTPAQVVAAARRAVVTMALDDACRPYSPETVAAVLTSTVEGFAGAGTVDQACLRVAQNERLAHLPEVVVADLFRVAVRHFAKALNEVDNEDLAAALTDRYGYGTHTPEGRA